MSKRRCFLVGLSNRESRKADMSRQIECKVQTVKVVIQISKSAALTLSCLDWLAQAVPTFSFLHHSDRYSRYVILHSVQSNPLLYFCSSYHPFPLQNPSIDDSRPAWNESIFNQHMAKFLEDEQ